MDPSLFQKGSPEGAWLALSPPGQPSTAPPRLTLAVQLHQGQVPGLLLLGALRSHAEGALTATEDDQVLVAGIRALVDGQHAPEEEGLLGTRAEAPGPEFLLVLIILQSGGASLPPTAQHEVAAMAGFLLAQVSAQADVGKEEGVASRVHRGGAEGRVKPGGP